jgi:hypothetical protein
MLLYKEFHRMVIFYALVEAYVSRRAKFLTFNAQPTFASEASF